MTVKSDSRTVYPYPVEEFYNLFMYLCICLFANGSKYNKKQ